MYSFVWLFLLLFVFSTLSPYILSFKQDFGRIWKPKLYKKLFHFHHCFLYTLPLTPIDSHFYFLALPSSLPPLSSPSSLPSFPLPSFLPNARSSYIAQAIFKIMVAFSLSSSIMPNSFVNWIIFCVSFFIKLSKHVTISSHFSFMGGSIFPLTTYPTNHSIPVPRNICIYYSIT